MDVEDRLVALEARLRAAEDQLEILNLLNRYGPLADSGSGPEAAALWIEGGGYTYSGGQSGGTRLEAPDQLLSIYTGEGHRGLMAVGSAHVTAAPVVKVDGDRATVIGYTIVIMREGDRWFPMRAAVNEWQCVRTPDGWRIAERINRTLTGSEDSRDLMRKVIAL